MKLGKLSNGAIDIGTSVLGKFKRDQDAENDDIAEVEDGETRSFLRLPLAVPLKLNKVTLGLGTAAAVFAIGSLMQALDGPSAPKPQPNAVNAVTAPQSAPALDVKNVRLTAAKVLPTDAESPAFPNTTVEAAHGAPDAEPNIAIATLDDPAMPYAMKSGSTAAEPAMNELAPVLTAAIGDIRVAPSTTQSAPALPCEIELTADPAPMAMVDLIVNASCLPNERFTLHHNGMMFHAETDDSGWNSLRVPALSQQAVFIASFSDELGAVAQIDVPTLALYDRVVVQWRGDTGLGLHALEFGADYFAEGHIHSDARGDMTLTADGTSGFLARFGDGAGPNALKAEVYTFPTQTTAQAGSVSLSVEAEVTVTNCGKQLDAQTMQLRPGETVRVKDVSLYMPDCAAAGDFLVLKNLLEDLKVASN